MILFIFDLVCIVAQVTFAVLTWMGWYQSSSFTIGCLWAWCACLGLGRVLRCFDRGDYC